MSDDVQYRATSGSSFVPELPKELLLIQLKAVYRNRGGCSVHSVIQRCAFLEFREDALSLQQPYVCVPKPYRWQICFPADLRHQIHAHGPV